MGEVSRPEWVEEEEAEAQGRVWERTMLTRKTAPGPEP